MPVPHWSNSIERNIAASKPVFEGAALKNIGVLDAFVPGISRMVFAGGHATQSDDSLEAHGGYRFFEVGELPAVLNIGGTDDDWQGRITVSVPIDSFSFPLAKRLSGSELRAVVRFQGSQDLITGSTFAFTMDVAAPGDTYSFSLAPTVIDSLWQLRLEGAELDPAAVSALLEKAGVADVLNGLPMDQVTGNISISRLSLLLRLPFGLPDGLGFDLRADTLSSPIKGIRISELCFSATAEHLTISATRRVFASFTATVTAEPLELTVFGQYPRPRFSGSLTCQDGVSIGALYKGITGNPLPGDVPDLALEYIEVDADMTVPSLLLRTSVSGDWPIPTVGVTLNRLSFDLALSASDPHVSVYALTRVAGSDVDVSATIGQEIEFTGSMSPTTLTELLASFKIDKPSEVPEVKFGPLDVVINGPKKNLHINAGAAIDFDFLGAGKTSPLSISVAVDATPGKAPTVKLQVSCDAKITLDGGVTLDGFSFQYASQPDGSLKLGGTVSAKFLGDAIDLSAGYAKKDGKSVFQLNIASARKIIDVEDIAALTLKTFGISVVMPADSKQQRSFGIDVTGELNLAGIIKVNGALKVGTEGVFLMPESPSGGAVEVDIPLPFPASKPPTIVLGIEQVAIERVGGASADASKSGWQFKTTGSGAFKNIPSPADKVFGPKPTTASISAGSAGLSIDLIPPDGTRIDIVFGGKSKWRVAFPPIELKQFSLEQHTVDKQSHWQLVAALQVDGIDGLNALTAGHDVFEKSVGVEIILGTGFSVRPTSSPFKAFKLRPWKGAYWTEFFNFFDAGRMSFQVPDFSFDFEGGRWHAAGGMATEGPLQIPLRPVKWILKKCFVPPEALKPLPDAMPLQTIDFKDKHLFDTFEAMLGKIDKEAEAVMRRIVALLQEGIDELPARLGEYTKLSIPTNFTFSASVEPTGGASFGLHVEDKDPLKLLIPCIAGVPPMPSLTGVTLRYVSFGLTDGAQVGVFEAAGHIDQFSAIDIIYALTTHDTKGISNRFIMNELKALIPIYAPVPIPLFYEQIGWEYRNLLGIEMQLHAKFPDPKPTLGDWVKMILSLIRFFTVKDYLLHDKGHVPDKMQLDFQIQPTFLALPDYLGGGTLGKKGSLPKLPMTQTLALALDSIKTGNLGLLIQSVPLNCEKDGKTDWVRIGSEKVTFGPLSFKTAWCITTAEEFQDIILKNDAAKKQLALADPDKMLDCTPAHFKGKPYDKGFVILLMGGIDVQIPVTSIFGFDARFAVALLGPRDFQTGLRLFGAFGPKNMISLEINGYIGMHPQVSDPESTEIIVKGGTALTLLGSTFSSESSITVVPGKSFNGEILFTFTDALKVKGTLSIDAHKAIIDGKIIWSSLAGSPVELGSSAEFSNKGLIFKPASVKIGGFDGQAFLQLPGRTKDQPYTFGVRVTLPKSAMDAFKNSLVDTANKYVSQAATDAFNDLQHAIASMGEIEVSLRGLKAFVPGLCAGIINGIKNSIKQRNIYKAMDDWAGGNYLKKAAVALAKKFGDPVGKANNSAKPWLTKLERVRKAAAADIEDSDAYRTWLRNALTELNDPKQNEVNIKVAGFKKFPGVTVYTFKPVLNSKNRNKITEAITVIGNLQVTSNTKVKAAKAFNSKELQQRVLAEVRQQIKDGMLSKIPTVDSVELGASADIVKLASASIDIAATYNKKTYDFRITADLTSPLDLPKQIANGFAKVLK